jgi:hypothetical protein
VRSRTWKVGGAPGGVMIEGKLVCPRYPTELTSQSTNKMVTKLSGLPGCWPSTWCPL